MRKTKVIDPKFLPRHSPAWQEEANRIREVNNRKLWRTKRFCHTCHDCFFYSSFCEAENDWIITDNAVDPNHVFWEVKFNDNYICSTCVAMDLGRVLVIGSLWSVPHGFVSVGTRWGPNMIVLGHFQDVKTNKPNGWWDVLTGGEVRQFSPHWLLHHAFHKLSD